MIRSSRRIILSRNDTHERHVSIQKITSQPYPAMTCNKAPEQLHNHRDWPKKTHECAANKSLRTEQLVPDQCKASHKKCGRCVKQLTTYGSPSELYKVTACPQKRPELSRQMLEPPGRRKREGQRGDRKPAHTC